jgi:transposase-like protein
MPRKYHSIDTKVAIATAARHRLAKGEQLKPLARQYGLQASQLKTWMRRLPAMEQEVEASGDGRQLTMGKGRPSSLAQYEAILMQ